MATIKKKNRPGIHWTSMKYLKMIQQPDENEDMFIQRGRLLLEEAKENQSDLLKMATGVYWILVPFPLRMTRSPKPGALKITFESRSLEGWAVHFTESGAELAISKGASPPHRVYDVVNSVQDRYRLAKLLASTWWRRQGHTFDGRAQSQQLRHRSVRSRQSAKPRPTEKPLLVQALQNRSRQPHRTAMSVANQAYIASPSERMETGIESSLEAKEDCRNDYRPSRDGGSEQKSLTSSLGKLEVHD